MTPGRAPAGRVPVWAQVVLVTAAASAVLGLAVAAYLLAVEPGGGVARRLRLWGVGAVIASPVGFVFGALAFVIGRAIVRGRRAPQPPEPL